jgi:pimeloyl-ACP methyl ester carboxylesterase
MSIRPLVLNFRSAVAGGDVNPYPDLIDFHANWRHDKLVLLIHGFNNTIAEAQNAYTAFMSLQSKLANYAAGDDFAPDRDFVEVYWKGDDWGPASAVYYPNAIPNAIQTATALALVLKNLAILRPGGLSLQIVAHSLGTRLSLELLKSLSGDPHITVSRLVFFAAATPTFMMEGDGQAEGLRRAYEEMVTEGAMSLYSGADIVLSKAFPVGQSIAPGAEGFFPVALGHRYWTSIHCPPTLLQGENKNANHSDYWGWNRATEETCGKWANIVTRQFLGFSGLGDRATPDNETLTRTTPEGQDGQCRTTPDRTTECRIV